jgi:PAS domain S-box-containing protein
MSSTEPSVPILMVDDNRSKRLALKSVLSPLGFSITEADSGLAALRCVMERDFAAILLDVVMPVMDGFETAATIRQRRQSETTPIIFITARGRDEIKKRDLFAEGAADFIFAPVPPHELRAKLSVFANLFLEAQGLAARARELEESAERLRLVTEFAPVGIFQTDAENRYVYTNPRWSEITGIPSQEALGSDRESIVSADQRAALVPEATDQPELRHRFEMRVADEPARTVCMTSNSIPDGDGETSGWVGTLADVTEQKACPGRALDGALLSVINGILDLSKVEAGALDAGQTELDPRAVVNEVSGLLAEAASTRGLELVTTVDAAVPDLVEGDRAAVRQVLINLIGTAVTFTRPGKIAVRVSDSGGEGADGLVRFEVSGTGEGMAPGEVFEPLAVCGRLAALMGGDCGVSTRRGEERHLWLTIAKGRTRQEA